MTIPINKTPRIKVVTGAILVGGRSSRFGSNKAMAEIGGKKLIDRAAQTMSSIFSKVVLSSNTPEEYSYLDLPIYEDIIKDLGPIGGIYTVLKSIEDTSAFFVACDMPFLNEKLIRHMVEIRGDHDVIVPRVGWKIEALHSLYSRNCLPVIEKTIAAMEFKTMNIFSKVNTRYVEEEELREFDPELHSFINVNKPQELRDLLIRETHQEA
jgi:molybdopterin-guanine dinucleotide biosynthesis protein A